MLADVVVKHVAYPILFYVGSVPMFVSFFTVTLLSHWEEWDPVGQCFNWLVGIVCRSSKKQLSVSSCCVVESSFLNNYVYGFFAAGRDVPGTMESKQKP